MLVKTKIGQKLSFSASTFVVFQKRKDCNYFVFENNLVIKLTNFYKNYQSPNAVHKTVERFKYRHSSTCLHSNSPVLTDMNVSGVHRAVYSVIACASIHHVVTKYILIICPNLHQHFFVYLPFLLHVHVQSQPKLFLPSPRSPHHHPLIPSICPTSNSTPHFLPSVQPSPHPHLPSLPFSLLPSFLPSP